MDHAYNFFGLLPYTDQTHAPFKNEKGEFSCPNRIFNPISYIQVWKGMPKQSKGPWGMQVPEHTHLIWADFIKIYN